MRNNKATTQAEPEAMPSSSYTHGGVLVDGRGKHPVMITEREHAKLSVCLKVMRGETSAAAAEALEWLLVTQKYNTDSSEKPASLFAWLTFKYLEEYEPDSLEGVLVATREDENVYPLDQGGLRLLRSILIIHERGGWFAEWLERELPQIAKAETASKRAPAPLEILGSITREVDEFDAEIEVAQRMFGLRPDLVTAAAPAAETTAAPAVAEVTAEPPATRQHTRGVGKKSTKGATTRG